MASQAYKESMDLKKQRQAKHVWSQIGNLQQLEGLVHLHDEIKDVKKKRGENRQFMQQTGQNYISLRKNIKDFIRVQNIDKKKR